MTVKGDGRDQYRRTASARARRPNLSRYYARKMSKITPGEYVFHLDLLTGRQVIRLDETVASFEWVDEDAILTGSMTLHRPDPAKRSSLPIGRGMRVRCRVKTGGRLYELWTMRTEPPEVQVEDGTVSVALKDDMELVTRSRRHYVFRKTKRRPHGWFGHKLLRAAARKDGIKLGTITKCEHRMPKVDLRGSFLDLAVKVYAHEREKTGRTLVLRMRNGRFEAVPYRRNRILYVLADEIRSAFVTQEPKKARPATVIMGRGRIGKKRIRHTEFRRDIVRRFGYVKREENFGKVDSRGELRRRCKRLLARNLRVETKATVQVQGIPFIRRGDGCQLRLPSEGFRGEDSFVYATAVRHQVQGGTYTTEADFTRVDPFLKDRERREKAQREKKRKERDRRKRSS